MSQWIRLILLVERVSELFGPVEHINHWVHVYNVPYLYYFLCVCIHIYTHIYIVGYVYN